jgi:hypothetical protein
LPPLTYALQATEGFQRSEAQTAAGLKAFNGSVALFKKMYPGPPEWEVEAFCKLYSDPDTKYQALMQLKAFLTRHFVEHGGSASSCSRVRTAWQHQFNNGGQFEGRFLNPFADSFVGNRLRLLGNLEASETTKLLKEPPTPDVHWRVLEEMIAVSARTSSLACSCTRACTIPINT